MAPFRTCLLWLSLALAAIPRIAAARPLDPPSLALHASTATLVAVELLRVAPDGRLIVRKLADLHGATPAPAELAVLAPDWLAPQLEPGRHYILAYSAVATDPYRPRSLVADPHGPRLLTSAGLEPALFADTPEARTLLADYPRGTAAQGATYRKRVLEGLAADDPQWQRYFAAEIALRPALAAALTAPERERVRAFAARADAAPSARAMLLVAALSQSAAYDAQRYDAIARDVLASLPVQDIGGADDGRAVLAHAAFTWCARRDVTLPAELLARWLRSDEAPLVEAALLAVRRGEPARERALAEAALGQSLLPVTTRTFLRDHLRRLDVMEQALQQQRVGRRDE